MNMRSEIIKDFVIPDGKYFEDVEGEIYLEGFRGKEIEVAEIYNWRKDKSIGAPEFTKIIERDVKIGIYIGKFDKNVFSLTNKIKKSIILLDQKIHSFGYIPTPVMKNVLVGWEVIKNEIVEK